MKNISLRLREIEGQESTYSDSEDLWHWGLNYVLTWDSEDEGLDYVSIRDSEGKGLWRTWPNAQVYLSKAKLGIYNEYLVLYILFWDRGDMWEQWVIVE